MLVIADTGPVNYLILIGRIDILPALFGRIILPEAVHRELSSPKAPPEVKSWTAELPGWIEVLDVPQGTTSDVALQTLDAGEREAIALAVDLGADLLLIDDREGVKVAGQKGLETTGTIGVLALAARRGLVDLVQAFDCLRETNFRCPEQVMASLLARYRRNVY